MGPCNLAMGSHDQWQLQAEYTVGSWLLAGGVGQTVGNKENGEALTSVPSVSFLSLSAWPQMEGRGWGPRDQAQGAWESWG